MTMLTPTDQPAVVEQSLRGVLLASLAKRSVPTMDPLWTAAFNAALDMVARDVALFLAHSDARPDEPRVDRWRKASLALGSWMSAALDDPKVCDAMKGDIREWFGASEPFEGMSARPDVGEKLAAANERIAELEDELIEVQYQPWPKWADDMRNQIRAVSGYDGYDDATDGVDLPAELDELISHLTEDADKSKIEARAARKLDELERSVEHYRTGIHEWIARAQAAEAALSAAMGGVTPSPLMERGA